VFKGEPMTKILIVEDDASVSELVKSVLEDNGYEVVTVPDAEKAKIAISSGFPDLALVDIILPGQGGMDLILELHSTNPELKIIITSGKIDMTMSPFKVLAYQFGVLSILPKPFTIEELLDSVKKAIAA
jgi:DNA-binding NtrC family response regulator